MAQRRNGDRLERFAAELERQLGENLVALVLFGPAVRRDDPAREHELTTLLVVRDASPKALRPAFQPIADWVKRGQPPPLVFSERGLRASADVFPIEIEEMREAHEVLRGTAPFDGVTTTREDLRRELEREVRSKLLRLRTEFAAAAPGGKALERLLLDSIGTFLILFRAVVRLTEERPPSDRRALIAAACARTGMDPSAFDWLLAKLEGQKCVGLTGYDPVGERYVEQIERLADWVDRQAGDRTRRSS